MVEADLVKKFMVVCEGYPIKLYATLHMAEIIAKEFDGIVYYIDGKIKDSRLTLVFESRFEDRIKHFTEKDD